MKKTIIIFGSLLLLAFTLPDKPYIYLCGQKYYKCFTRTEIDNDTLFEPGGFTVIKTQTKMVFYDHFKCDGMK